MDTAHQFARRIGSHQNGTRGIYVTTSVFHPGAERLLASIENCVGIDKDKFLSELKKVKTDRITSDEPEATYDALNKYGLPWQIEDNPTLVD